MAKRGAVYERRMHGEPRSDESARYLAAVSQDSRSSVITSVASDSCATAKRGLSVSSQASTPTPHKRRRRCETPNDGRCRFEGGAGSVLFDDVSSRQYRVVKKLGQGTFAKVLLCTRNDDRRNEVAIKVVHAIRRYRESTEIEATMLQDIHRSCPGVGVVPLLGRFEYNGHACLVFPKLGPSLLQVMERNDYVPFDNAAVRGIASCLLRTLQHLSDANVIHTDIKPENVLFRSTGFYSEYTRGGREIFLPTSYEVVLIDFGSAQYDDEYKGRTVQTRNYRAPEVIATKGKWSTPSDMWSVGCMLLELLDGALLFATDDDLDHLHCMEVATGQKWPSFYCREGSSQFFERDVAELRALHPQDSQKHLNQRTLRHLCQRIPGSRVVQDDVLDMLYGMLNLHPHHRLTPSQALACPFLAVQPW